MDLEKIDTVAAIDSVTKSSVIQIDRTPPAGVNEFPYTMFVLGPFVAVYDIECSLTGSDDDDDWVPCMGILANGTKARMVDLDAPAAWPISTIATHYRLNVTAYTSGALRASLVTGILR